MRDGKGYMIPDNPDPLGDVCITVNIPNDELYLAAFWGAYEYFTTWKAWQRDTNKTGKICAARWKSAFQIARTNYEKEDNCMCGCGCGCQGDTDFSISGGQYPVEQVTSNASVNLYREAMQRVIDSKVGAVPIGDAVSDFLNAYPSANAKDAYDLISKVYLNEPTVGIDDPDWNIIRNQVGCDINVLTMDVLDTMKSTARVTFSSLDTAWMELADVFEGFTNTELSEQLYLMSIYDDLPDFGVPDCTSVWMHTFDFTANDGGFTPYAELGSDRASYSPGVGWVDGVWAIHLVQIEKTIPATYISDISMVVSGGFDVVQFRAPDVNGSEYQASSQANFSVRKVITGLWFSVDEIPLNQVGILTSITINGTGVNPFI